MLCFSQGCEFKCPHICTVRKWLCCKLVAGLMNIAETTSMRSVTSPRKQLREPFFAFLAALTYATLTVSPGSNASCGRAASVFRQLRNDDTEQAR